MAENETNGFGRKALEQQGEISRALGRLEGQLSQLQESVDNMRGQMDRENDDVGQRVDHLETRMRGQDQKLVAGACAVIAAVGAEANLGQLARLVTTFF